MATHGKRRALGQHFLKDPRICREIAETALSLARKHACAALLEIGPGKGAITEPLLEGLASFASPPRFFVSEKDRNFAADWRIRKVSVEEGDFLDLEESTWLARIPLGVVSNLPYSAGTAIVTRLAARPEKIPFMVLMFQAEVAHRLRAEPGTKAWGSLSIWIQNRWDVRKLLAVPPGAFAPPPEVQSEVVVLTRRENARVAVDDNTLWEALLKACFAHRRKMLRACLRDTKGLKNALELSGVDDTKRAEALNWEEWERLYRAAARG